MLAILTRLKQVLDQSMCGRRVEERSRRNCPPCSSSHPKREPDRRSYNR